jgi:hypothetical protein
MISCFRTPSSPVDEDCCKEFWLAQSHIVPHNLRLDLTDPRFGITHLTDWVPSLPNGFRITFDISADHPYLITFRNRFQNLTLPRGPSLQTLHMGSNFLGRRAVAALSNALQSNKALPLTSLDLSCNPDIGVEAGTLFRDALVSGACPCQKRSLRFFLHTCRFVIQKSS